MMSEFERTHCNEWKAMRKCPEGEVMVGVDIHTTGTEIHGLARTCASVTVRDVLVSGLNDGPDRQPVIPFGRGVRREKTEPLASFSELTPRLMTRSLLGSLAAALLLIGLVPDASAQRQRDRAQIDAPLHRHVIEVTYDDPEAAQQGDPSHGTISVHSTGAPQDELWNPTSIYLSSTADPMDGSMYGLTRDENGLLSMEGMIPGPMEIGSVGLDSDFLMISFEVDSRAGMSGSSGGMGVKSDDQKAAKEQRKQDKHDARMERKAVRTARLAARGHVESVTVNVGLAPPRFKINVSRYPPTMPTGPEDAEDQFMGGVSVIVE